MTCFPKVFQKNFSTVPTSIEEISSSGTHPTDVFGPRFRWGRDRVVGSHEGRDLSDSTRGLGGSISLVTPSFSLPPLKGHPRYGSPVTDRRHLKGDTDSPSVNETSNLGR